MENTTFRYSTTTAIEIDSVIMLPKDDKNFGLNAREMKQSIKRAVEEQVNEKFGESWASATVNIEHDEIDGVWRHVAVKGICIIHTSGVKGCNI